MTKKSKSLISVISLSLSAFVNNGYGSGLCENIRYFKVSRDILFQIPQINPAVMNTETPSFNIENIDHLMCFSKLNLPEKSCLSIHVRKYQGSSTWHFFGHFHDALHGRVSAMRYSGIDTSPELDPHGYALCSMCKFGDDPDLPDTIELGAILSNKAGFINDCERAIGDSTTYNTNFNARTQGVGQKHTLASTCPAKSEPECVSE